MEFPQEKKNLSLSPNQIVKKIKARFATTYHMCIENFDIG